MKEKLTSYNFWIRMVSVLLLFARIVGQEFGFEIDSVLLMDIATAIAGILVVLGVISAPVSSGAKNLEGACESPQKQGEINMHENIEDFLIESLKEETTDLSCKNKQESMLDTEDEGEKACPDSLLENLSAQNQSVQNLSVCGTTTVSPAIKEVVEKFNNLDDYNKTMREAQRISTQAESVVSDSAEVQKDSAEVQKDSVEVQKDSAEVQKDSAEVQKDSAEVQKDSAEVQKDSAEVQNVDVEVDSYFEDCPKVIEEALELNPQTILETSEHPLETIEASIYEEDLLKKVKQKLKSTILASIDSIIDEVVD